MAKKKQRTEKSKISTPKGRPMLNWVGKKPLDYIKSFPAQLMEVFDPTKQSQAIENPNFEKLEKNWQNLLFQGDNKELLGYLLNNGFRGKIDLIYIDPPFNTGVDYLRKINLRGIKMEKLKGEDYTFTEQLQYFNNWHIDAYLQFLYERIQMAREILSDKGIIFIRMDVHFGYLLRLITDEIFGKESFQNEIQVNRIKKNVTQKGRRTIPNAVDYLYIYFNGSSSEFRDVLKKLPQTKPGYWHNMDSSGIPGPRKLTLGGKIYYPSPGAHLKFPQKQAEKMWEKGKIREHPKTGILEYWVEEKDFENLDSNWTDIPGYSFKTGYPTENSEQLLKRVINAGSLKNDIVLDFFMGSGTTSLIAQELGRRWIGCDINKGAIQTTSKRLQDIISSQMDEQKKKGEKLFKEDEGNKYYSFATYKINDYDLQILHTEAIELAAEHIGIKRTKTDNFFDGTLGKKLVKIIDFHHPLSLLDLQLIQDELKKRPNEDRNITVVCLGKELPVDKWIEEYNKKHPINKIGVIELRTDSKYGKILIHKPCEAKVKIKREKDKVFIEIENFISPTIIERLNIDDDGLFKVKIPDFRSMIDVVLIDTNYNGKVFNIHYSDVPVKKNDLVEGKYKIDIPKKKVTIAVKIIDMLGEELLVTKTV